MQTVLPAVVFVKSHTPPRARSFVAGEAVRKFSSLGFSATEILEKKIALLVCVKLILKIY